MRQSRWTRHLFLMAILATTVVVYWPSIEHPFQYDDESKVAKNATLKSPLRIISELFRPGYHENATRLIPNLTLALNYWMAGTRPFVYNVTNLLVHLLNIWLLLRLLRLLIRHWHPDVPPSFTYLAAGLFAIHPLNTEAVNYCNARPNTICATFILLGTALIFRWAKAGHLGRRNMRALALGIGSCICAMLSKEMGVIVLVICPIVVGLSFPNATRTFISTHKGALLTGCIVVGILLVSLGGVGALAQLATSEHSGDLSPMRYRAIVLLDQASALMKYVSLAVWPSSELLNIDHSVIGIGEQSRFSNAGNSMVYDVGIRLACMAVCTYCVLLAISVRHTKPLICLGILWVAVSLAPTSLFPRAEQVVEYRTYVAMVGGCVLLALGINGIMKLAVNLRGSLTSQMFVVVLIGALLSSNTIQRNIVWRSSMELWHDAARKVPEGWRPNYNAGLVHLRERQFEAAFPYLERATKAPRHTPEVHAAFGDCLQALGRNEVAIREYEVAMSEGAVGFELSYNVSALSFELGNTTKALDYGRRAVAANPGAYRARLNLGHLLLRMGHLSEAVIEYEAAVAISHDMEAIKSLEKAKNAILRARSE